MVNLFLERDRAGLCEHVDVLGDCFEVDGRKLGADRVANVVDRAFTVDEVHDLIVEA